MTTNSTRILHWAPRILAIAFIGFLSLFSLDVFNEGLGFVQTIRALAIHLRPSIVLAIVLAIAWRREWIGTLGFSLAGAHYVWTVAQRRDLSILVRLNWCGLIAGPALLVAILFWKSWGTRRMLRADCSPNDQ